MGRVHAENRLAHGVLRCLVLRGRRNSERRGACGAGSAAGGYFPGLITAPLVGVASVFLFMRLVAITEFRRSNTNWRQIVRFFETILFSVVVPGAVTYWIPRDVFHLWTRTMPNLWTPLHSIAMIPLALGLAVYVHCVWEFGARGRGIPAPVDHPKQIVVTGLYQYVRNPMYIGVLLFLLGESLFFGSWTFLIYTMAWLAFVHINVLLYKEPNLRRKFDGSYDRCQSSSDIGSPENLFRHNITRAAPAWNAARANCFVGLSARNSTHAGRLIQADGSA